MGHRYRNIRAFSLGVLAGGLIVGTGHVAIASIAIGWPPYIRHGALIAVGAIATFGPASRKYPETPGWLPNPRRQVSFDTASRGPRGLAVFGLQMGLGFRTFITARVPYAVVALAALGYLGTLGALTAGVGFGIGRLVPVAVTVTSGERGLIRLAKAVPKANSLAGRAAAMIAAMSLAVLLSA